MKVLVTGADGQLGSEIRRKAAISSDSYIFTDVAQLDITNINAIRKTVRDNEIEVVVNCAAYTNVDKAESDQTTADLINNKAVGMIAAACKEVGATLIHISTDYVFDGSCNLPYSEDMSTSPLGVYGRTKLASEVAVKASGCNYIILRTSWLYSQYGNNFVKTMRRLTAERESLNVVFDQAGTPTYAGDLAAFICKVIEGKSLANQGVYHFSNEGVCSWYDFAVEIAKFSGNECDIRPCHSNEFPSKTARPHYSVLDKTKVKNTFSITIPHWRESLAKCIDELKAQE